MSSLLTPHNVGQQVQDLISAYGTAAIMASPSDCSAISFTSTCLIIVASRWRQSSRCGTYPVFPACAARPCGPSIVTEDLSPTIGSRPLVISSSFFWPVSSWFSPPIGHLVHPLLPPLGKEGRSPGGGNVATQDPASRRETSRSGFFLRIVDLEGQVLEEVLLRLVIGGIEARAANVTLGLASCPGR